jgi:protein O-mannosyl-transferase
MIRSPLTITPVRFGLRSILAFAAIAIAVWFVYSPTLRGEWLWDDDAEISQNSEIVGSAGIAKIWFAPSAADYFPLKSTVQWFAWRIWHESALGWHCLNIGLHLISAVLIWRLFTTLQIPCAWLGGLLFAVHPLNVESVAWIAELKNTISLPLLLIAMDSYARFARCDSWVWYVVSLVLFVGSLLGKTSGVMLPAVLLMYYWWRHGRITLRSVRLLMPFFGAAALLGWVTIRFQHERAIGEWAIPLGGFGWRAVLASTVLGFYVTKFVFPVSLAPIYPPWNVNPAAISQYLPALAFVVLFLTCWKINTAGARALGFGFGAYIVMAFPVLGFVSMSYMHYSWVADHFMYVPVVGLIGISVAGFSRVFQWQDAVARRAGIAGIITLSGTLLFVSHSYAKVFQGEIPFWTFTITRNPGVAVGHNNLGKALQNAGRMSDAHREYDMAIACEPMYADAHNNLGTWFDAMGNLREAMTEYQLALRLKPKFALAYNNIGNLYVKRGLTTYAINAYKNAINAAPELVGPHVNLGNALFLAGNGAEAIAEFRTATAIQPRSVFALQNLARVELRLGRTENAVRDLGRALTIAPENAGLCNDLGYAMLTAGRLDDAMHCYETTLRLEPRNRDAHINLGGLCYRLGNIADAIAHYRAAAAIDPQSTEARHNLDILSRSGHDNDMQLRNTVGR